MARKDNNLYEMLGVAPTASTVEMKAAHRRLSMEFMAGKHGLSREETDYQLQLLDVALSTLTDPPTRDAYDARLTAQNRPNLPTAPAPGHRDGRALQLAEAVQEMHRTRVAIADEDRFPFGAASSVLGATGRSMKTILRIVFWLLFLGLAVRAGGCALAARKPALPAAEVAKAEEKLIIQAYFKKHGVRAASRAEVASLEAEHRRQENERRAEQFNQRKLDDSDQQFIKESREHSRRLELEQERAEANARQEAMRRQREAQSASRASDD